MFKKAKFNPIALAVIAGALVLVGLYLVFRSHAATNNADFNASGKVDVTDLSILGAHFGQTGVGLAQGDADGNGKVDVVDLSILASQWNTNPAGGGSCAAPSCFPNASNTGVPAGTNLTTYTGPTTVSSCGTVIDSKIINSGINIIVGNGTHSASTPCVTIKNSLIKGQVDAGYASQNHGPVVMTDDEIAIPTPNSGDFSALQEANIYATRLNIHGGRHNIQCDGFCDIRDSYVHDNWFVAGAHMNAFITNGSYGNPTTLIHNSFICKIISGSPGAGSGNGGCTADVSFIADYSTITNTLVDSNLFMASPDPAYCAYTGGYQPKKPFPNGTNLVWKNNVFQRGASGQCTSSGPLYGDWAPTGAGNIWSNNKWDDGTVLNP